MKKGWIGVLGVMVGCATTPQPPPATASAANDETPAPGPTVAVSQATDEGPAKPAADTPAGETEDTQGSAAKQTAGCTPLPDAEPKVVSGDDVASDLGDTGRALVLNVAGVSLELPACTPGADTEVLELSWETQERPTSSHVHPDFTRHAATVRMPFPIKALEGAPLRVRLNTHRKLTKPGQKLVAAVEFSGECKGRYKRDPLEFGGCSHWRLFDTHYDKKLEEMVAEVPELGGYRIQFGWMPAK